MHRRRLLPIMLIGASLLWKRSLQLSGDETTS
ncbi:hypothetical protein SAMN05216252_12738 [Actinacidiphila glaucinigra]|uniref:REJ domain-containing protein n=1 Tax=Actinacidiphila glaucinigra TaxID=235986 RepID=A0A239MSU6_9ACTN|nr:hypothetical protein SAMN05216252_12738 [Actinacidiphila glaucinigra]